MSFTTTKTILTPAYALEVFLKSSPAYYKTPLVTSFFAPSNIIHIVDEIKRSVSAAVKQPIGVFFNEELLQTMCDVARDNMALAYGGERALSILNQSVVQHESNVMYNSLVRQQLWKKYFITQDRMRVFPRAVQTKDTKGDSVISTSGYMLSSPWARWRKGYLHDTQGIICDNGSQTYQNIPGFMQTKVPSAYTHDESRLYDSMPLPSPQTNSFSYSN